MSIPEKDRVLKDMEDAVREAERQAILRELEPFCSQVEEPSTSQASRRRQPRKKEDVRWIKRDSDGNIVYTSPRSNRKPAGTPRPRQTVTSVGESRDLENVTVDFTAITAEAFLEELHQSLPEDIADKAPPPQASSDWSVRKSHLSGWWAKERPRLVNTMLARHHAAPHLCQLCANSPAVICCHECRPQPFLCGGCDVKVHQRYTLHNRDMITKGFFQPLPPTTGLVEGVLTSFDRLVPLEIPESICLCQQSIVIAGQPIVVVTMNGRYDLRLPQVKCQACEATWSPGIDDLIRHDYWPATSQYSTVYSTDVLFSYEELKMVAPGMSFQAFLRMLDQRTVRFGRSGTIIADSFRTSFFEWEAVRSEMDKICREDPFDCPACSPDILAVSVDGNRKLYRFKTAARSEEHALFDGLFIAKDDDVARFVDYIHSVVRHVPGRGVCGGQWSAAREVSTKSMGKMDEEGLQLAVCRHGVLLRALNMFRGEIFAYPLYLQKEVSSKPVTFFASDVACKYWPYLQKVVQKCPELRDLVNMKPFLSVFHAKGHDFKCEVKCSGTYQEGAGLTLGEEVEQCNAFLSRIAVTTKHMSKAGRIDMLTVMAMRWNQQKFGNLATSLTRRYQKTTVALQSQLGDLEAMKREMHVDDGELESWLVDVKEWAEATTSPADADVGAVTSRIEDLAASVKRRSQRLYKDSDGSKARARMRRKIREEKGRLSSAVDQYNTMVPHEEQLTVESILSEDVVWPWQLTHSDTVDLRTKRKAFDLVMAGRRLEEEKTILVAEMQKHWKCLSTRAATLNKMSSQLLTGETHDLLENGIKGLQSLALRKKTENDSMLKHAKNCYVQVLTELTDFDINSDSDDYYSDSDSGQE